MTVLLWALAIVGVGLALVGGLVIALFCLAGLIEQGDRDRETLDDGSPEWWRRQEAVEAARRADEFEARFREDAA